MSAVAEVLLCDARNTLLREVSPLAGRHDHQEAFAAWLLPGNDCGVRMDGAIRSALTAAGAGRTYREVAVLGYAAHACRLDEAGMATLAAGLRWLTAREPVVSGVPMPFCTDSVGLLGVALAARALAEEGLKRSAVSWLARCLEARAGDGDGGGEDVLLVGVEWAAGRAGLAGLLNDPTLADVRVGLRSRGLLTEDTGRADEEEEYDALALIRQETAASIGTARAALRLAALQSLKSKKPERQSPRMEGRSMPRKEIDNRKVFVVHGRNDAARNALFTFLRSLGLHPLEWSEIVKETGQAAPYVGEVLRTGFSIVQAVVVLMTPDDEAQLREQYRQPHDPPHEVTLTPQARPNVILEAGMALGLFPDRTVIVELGNLRPMSDTMGRHVIRMNDSPEKRQDLAQRLETAGCAVNRTGTDWYKAGDFATALR